MCLLYCTDLALGKNNKVVKATQETTQPISPITSQINGPGVNSTHVYSYLTLNLVSNEEK